MPNIEETIKDIKTQCRLAMNGMVSTAMRERGINYRLNFGVEYPRIREIARRHAPDHALASELWKSGIRELQIMAGILQPAETFDPDIADIWIGDIHNSELAEMTSMNLFSRLPYASEAAFKWIAADDEMTQYCGYLTITRLLARGAMLNERAIHELTDQAIAAALTEDMYPRQGAINALRELALSCEDGKQSVLAAIRPCANSANPLGQELRTQIAYALGQ